jgi:hypothetical protein
MKLSETAKEVIALADAIRTYWDAELPKRHRDYPFIHPGEDSGPPPPEEKRLKDLLAALPEDAVYQLALIASLGRGDFEPSDLARRYEEVKEAFGKPEEAALELREQAPLADYLADGLDVLRKSGLDVDHLTLTPVSSGG